MELRHIRYFLAVADAEHFTRAADDLHVSQPALSQQVRQLEEELGTPLFDRMGRRVRLTRAGETFRAHARRILAEVTEAHSALHELDALERGVLTVAAVQTVNAYMIPPVVSRFRKAYPGITLKVEELSADEIERGVREGRLDLGLTFVPAREEGLAAEALFEEELVLVASTRHRLARRRSVEVSALDGEPLVLLPQKFCTRRVIDAALQTARVQPRVAVEMNSIEGILRTVKTSAGATIVPELAIGLSAGLGLKVIRLANPTPRRTVGIIFAEGAHRPAAAREFVAMLRAEKPPARSKWTTLSRQ